MNYSNPLRCWLFCEVIDNFGDIGVCWRLARQLQYEHHFQVTLFVDDLTVFQKICPQVNVQQSVQLINGIEIRQWNEKVFLTFEKNIATIYPDLLIEAFACDLPRVIQKYASQYSIIWLNLEYLSAEGWVEGIHLLHSPQKQGGSKQFFFPGFTEKTGGLLREANLDNDRTQFLNSQTSVQAFREQLFLPKQQDTERYSIFIFSYENDILLKWVNVWHNLKLPLDIWLAPSQNLDSLRTLFIKPPISGDQLVLDSLTLTVLPMVDQQNFDKILWLADINIIRGEDSFIRAHWAHKPFFWHIYPQEEATHLIKLHAFWDKVYTFYGENICEAHRSLNLELNQENLLSDADRAYYWQVLFNSYQNWHEDNKKWTGKQQDMKSLSEHLVKLVKKSLK